MAANINIYGTFNSMAEDQTVAKAAQIYDDNKSKNQQTINQELEEKIDNIELTAEHVEYDLTSTPDLGSGDVQSAVETLDGKLKDISERTIMSIAQKNGLTINYGDTVLSASASAVLYSVAVQAGDIVYITGTNSAEKRLCAGFVLSLQAGEEVTGGFFRNDATSVEHYVMAPTTGYVVVSKGTSYFADLRMEKVDGMVDKTAIQNKLDIDDIDSKKVEYTTIEGNNVQLKDGQGNKLMPNTENLCIKEIDRNILYEVAVKGNNDTLVYCDYLAVEPNTVYVAQVYPRFWNVYNKSGTNNGFAIVEYNSSKTQIGIKFAHTQKAMATTVLPPYLIFTTSENTRYVRFQGRAVASQYLICTLGRWNEKFNALSLTKKNMNSLGVLRYTQSGKGDTASIGQMIEVMPLTKYRISVIGDSWTMPSPSSSDFALDIGEFNMTYSATVRNHLYTCSQSDFANIKNPVEIETLYDTTRIQVSFRALASENLAILVERVSVVDKEDWSDAVEYSGAKIQLPTFKFKGFGHNKLYATILSSAAQGFAMYKDCVFQLADKGGCVSFNIDTEDRLFELNQFRLACASVNPNIHCNVASFAPSVESGYDFPLLYVADGLNNRLFVERITTSSSTTIQTITHDSTIYGEYTVSGSSSNFCIGGDGLLYRFANLGTDGLAFIVMNCPETDTASVTLTSADVVRTVLLEKLHRYGMTTPQAFIVRYGMIWYLYQSSDGHSKIAVWDAVTGKLYSEIDLSRVMSYEAEAIYFHNRKLYVTMNGVRRGWIINFD